jgi:hypothetical protein
MAEWSWATRQGSRSVAAWAAVSADTLSTTQTIVEIAGTLITAIAVLVGGYWAYYKFIKGRTFRPHVEVDVSGGWLGSDGALGLHLAVRLKNIGSGSIELVQRGTGVKVSRIAAAQGEAPAETRWTPLGVFEIFTEHEWVEPGESVSDELLIRLPLVPQVLEVHTRLVLRWKPRNVTVGARRIIVPDSSVPPQ